MKEKILHFSKGEVRTNLGIVENTGGEWEFFISLKFPKVPGRILKSKPPSNPLYVGQLRILHSSTLRLTGDRLYLPTKLNDQIFWSHSTLFPFISRLWDDLLADLPEVITLLSEWRD